MNSSPELSQLITLNEAARRLSVCRRTLEREIQRGRFPRPVKVRRTTRVEVASVERYLSMLRNENGTPA